MEFRDFPEALMHWTSRCAADPWLFQRDGHHWRWGSWQEAEDELLRLLAGLSEPLTGRRIAFWSLADPYSWIADLALQAAGGVTVPVGEDDERNLAELRLDSWARQAEGERSPDGAEALSLVKLFGDPEPQGEPVFGERRGATVVAAEIAAGRELSSGALMNRAAEIALRLGEAPRRDVVVFHRPLSVAGERIVWAWALGAGASAVLEPESVRWPLTVGWARPTILQGTAEELVELRHHLERLYGPWFKRRFQRRICRVRGLLLFGRASLERFEDRDLWESLGVRLVTIE